jgi:hypothetical protein
MKKLIILASVLMLLSSCRTVKCPAFSQNGFEYRINYGDERFDEMENLVTEVYWVENGDTTFLRNEYRKPYYLVNQEKEKVGKPLKRN